MDVDELGKLLENEISRVYLFGAYTKQTNLLHTSVICTTPSRTHNHTQTDHHTRLLLSVSLLVVHIYLSLLHSSLKLRHQPL